jgi:peroxiredoxin
MNFNPKPKIVISKGQTLPDVTFRTRVRDESIGGDNPYRWQDMTTTDYFSGKRVILFSLPGAFTPTCSTYQLPNFERMAPEFRAMGIDEIYCMSVNDSFVMNAWAKSQNLSNVKVIPDGSGTFTKAVGMLVDKDNLGFGYRSWRYAMVVNDGTVEVVLREAGINDNVEDDPYEFSTPESVMNYLKSGDAQEATQ